MLVCKYCNKRFPSSFFGVAKTTATKVYRRQKCRKCYYETKKKLRGTRYSWLENYKKSSSCLKCGNGDFRVLDFHHKEKHLKTFTLANAVADGMNIDKIKTEISKCVILCANCHRIEHYDEKLNKIGA